jgi:iron complex outermembrane receptor protein
VSRPTDPVFNSDGTYFFDQNEYLYVNPYAVAKEVTNEGKYNNLFGSFRADLELIKGLTAGWFGSWRKADRHWGYYAPPKSTIQAAMVNKGIGNITTDFQNERLMDISLNYKKVFGSHNLEATGVYEWQNQTYQGAYVQGRGFIADITKYNALQLGDITKVQPGDMSSYKNDRTVISFLGRINYSFLDRYLLTLSIRRDGSSVFGANNIWGNFPSASVAWKINQEPFMSNLKIFDLLKLRIGYGVTGNQQGLAPQKSLELVGGSGNAFFNGNIVTNFSTIQNANSDLKWETRYQTNIGIDFGLFKNRLNGTLDAYTATTKNLLFNYSVPQPPYPFGTVMANVGSILNNGIEATLNYQVIRSKEITLTLGGNVSFLRNKVLKLSGEINGIPLHTNYVNWGSNSYLIEGEPVGTYNILKHLGKDVANAETVVDANEDGKIDQGSQSLDRSIQGSALPTYTYAFTPSLNYKNFTMSMVWLGSGGNKIYNSIKQNFSFFEALGRSNLLASAIDYGLFTSKYGSDLWLEDGSFLRFENLTIGYQFNTEWSKYVSGFGLSLNAQNLATFTKYSGLDPEINVNGGSGSGGDYGIYPRTRSISLGLNIIFK